MTTYWLLGEKKPENPEIQSYDNTNGIENVVNNPSITFQGPDSPAAHSIKHSQSPEQNDQRNHDAHKQTPLEILNERERIKHEIATFVAKDLINNIDLAVREFRKSQSANFAAMMSAQNKSVCNGNDRGLITPTYDKELVISKGKVRDVVNRLNNSVGNDTKIVKPKPIKAED